MRWVFDRLSVFFFDKTQVECFRQICDHVGGFCQIFHPGFNNTEYVIYINTILIRIIRNTASSSTLQGISAASVASCVFLRRRRKTFGIFAVP